MEHANNSLNTAALVLGWQDLFIALNRVKQVTKEALTAKCNSIVKLKFFLISVSMLLPATYNNFVVSQFGVLFFLGSAPINP